MYNKKTWESNEIITKEALNNIENGIYNADEALNKRITKEYHTVNDMINADDLVVGDIVRTLGYYTLADGGGYIYEIVDDAKLDTTVVNIQLNNGLKAKYGLGLKFYDFNVLTIGVKRGDINAEANNALILEHVMFKYNLINKLYFPAGEVYYIANIHFDNYIGNTTSLTINIYGDIGVVNGEKMSRINTRNQDFICDKRGIDSDNPVIIGTKLIMNDMYIISTTFGAIPNGICFGQDINTPKQGQEVNFVINNSIIMGFDYGIYSPHWACGGSGGLNTQFANCHCGIYIGQAMHCFNARNFSFNDCAMGMDTGWGGTFARLENIHFSTGYLGKDRENYDEYIGILTRGGVTLDGIYYEPYNDNGFMNRCVLIKHEGYAYGIGPLYIKHASIGYPGSGNTGVFLKSDCYLGYGPSRVSDYNGGNIEPWHPGHYPNGAVIFENCTFPSYVSSLKNMIKINTRMTEKSKYGYQYKNLWWGYDFNGLEVHLPNLIISKLPSIRFKGYVNNLKPAFVTYKQIDASTVSERGVMYKEEYIDTGMLANVISAKFHNRINIDTRAIEFDVTINIDGTISNTANVTIGVYASAGNALRLVKKIKTIKPGETYNEFTQQVKFTLNPIVDLLNDETRVMLAYMSNTNSTDDLLTSADRQIIEYDVVIRHKELLGYTAEEKAVIGNDRE